MALTNEACRKEHFGKSNLANNGMMMYIIAYQNTEDIDIVFQDGTIVKNKRYKNFNKGKVGNPNKGNIPEVPQVGETNVANNGQRMIIIAYRNARDIDVQFEDNTIVRNKTYGAFLKHSIGNPNFKK